MENLASSLSSFKIRYFLAVQENLTTKMTCGALQRLTQMVFTLPIRGNMVPVPHHALLAQHQPPCQHLLPGALGQAVQPHAEGAHSQDPITYAGEILQDALVVSLGDVINPHAQF